MTTHEGLATPWLHPVCMRVQRNILGKARFKDLPNLATAADVYIKAANAHTQQECDEYLSFLEDTAPEVHAYVMKVDKARWARAYLPFPSLGVLRSNIAGEFSQDPTVATVCVKLLSCFDLDSLDLIAVMMTRTWTLHPHAQKASTLRLPT